MLPILLAAPPSPRRISRSPVPVGRSFAVDAIQDPA
jgi:hypothetical protein